jgi:hypothetical protein
LTEDTNGKSLKGLLIEGARTNLVTKTDGTASTGGVWDTWTIGSANINGIAVTTTVAQTLLNITGSLAQRCQYTGVAADSNEGWAMLSSPSTANGSVAEGNIVTFSVFLKGIDVDSG